MSFKKLKPIKGRTACLTCGCGSHDTLDMDSLLGVGFGDCQVTKDGEEIYSEMRTPESDLWSAKDAERLATKDPDCDWRIHFIAPLYEAEYQRQGGKHWVLVSKGIGFA